MHDEPIIFIDGKLVTNAEYEAGISCRRGNNTCYYPIATAADNAPLSPQRVAALIWRQWLLCNIATRDYTNMGTVPEDSL